jgi:hypothetical protein
MTVLVDGFMEARKGQAVSLQVDWSGIDNISLNAYKGSSSSSFIKVG